MNDTRKVTVDVIHDGLLHARTHEGWLIKVAATLVALVYVNALQQSR
jgi:hypothetical protein